VTTATPRPGASYAELAEHWRTRALLARHDDRLPGIPDELRTRLRARADMWAARAAALEVRMRSTGGR
jgi:hypothetical protein